MSKRIDVGIELLRAIADGDSETLARHMSPALVWRLPASAAARRGGPRECTRDAVIEQNRELSGMWQRGTTYDIRAALEDNDSVGLFVTRHSTTVDGRAYDCDYAWLFRFEGDRIVEVDELLDTAYSRDFRSHS